MNRYTQLSGHGLNLPMLQLPYEQLDQVLATHKQGIDQFRAASNLTPDYLQNSPADVKLASQVVNYQKTLKDKLKEIGATGNVNAYTEALADVSNKLLDLYRPGGPAEILASRKKAYMSEQERINKETSKNVNPLYKEHFDAQLKKQLENQDIYDPNTRSGKQINPVNIFGEVIIGEEIDKHFKDFAKTKNVDLSPWVNPQTGKIDPYYIEKYTIEGLDPKDVQKSLEFFYSQPHIQQALAIDAWDLKRRITPEQGAALVENAKQESLTKFEADKLQAEKLLESWENNKNSKEVQDIVEAFGFKTLDELKKDTLLKIQIKGDELIKNPPTLDAIIDDNVKQKYTSAYLPKYTAQQEDRSLIANQPALIRLRASLKSKENDRMLNAYKKTFMSESPTFMGEVGVSETPISGVFTDYNDSRSNFKNVQRIALQDPAFRSMWEKVGSINNNPQPEQAQFLRTALVEAKSPDGTIDPIKLQNYMNTNGGRIDQTKAEELATYFNDPVHRNTLLRYGDMTSTPLAQLQSSQANVDKAMENLTDDDWNRISNMTGIGKRSGAVISTPAGPVQQTVTTNIEAVKQAAKEGNEKVLEALASLDKKMTTKNAVTIFKNPDMGKMDKVIVDAVTDYMPEYVAKNYMSLSEGQLKAMGYGKNGKLLEGVDKNPVSSVDIGSQKNEMTGKNEIIYVVKGAYGEEPVFIKPDNLNKSYTDEYLMTLLSKDVNPTNNEVINQENFNTLSSVYFDRNISAYGLTSDRLKDGIKQADKFVSINGRQTNNSNTVPISSFKDPMTGEQIVAKVVKNSQEGDMPYLIGIRESQLKTLEQFRDKDNPGSYRLNEWNSQDDYNSITMLNSTEDAIIDNALQEFKTEWAQTPIKNRLINQPFDSKPVKADINNPFFQNLFNN